VIKAALYEVLQVVGEVERIFLIIKAQREYCEDRAGSAITLLKSLATFRSAESATST